jgi:site-specific recombinase XerC
MNQLVADRLVPTTGARRRCRRARLGALPRILSRPTSATRTRAVLTPVPPMNSWPWCSSAGACHRSAPCSPVHVATWIEAGTRELAAPSVKQGLAAIRHLFDWLVTGQVVPVNPAASVGRPRHVVTSGQTPVLDPAEARALLDSIDTSTVVGLRDRALIGLMVYSFARIGAALGMTVEDVYTQNRRLWVRLREKGGKRVHVVINTYPWK